jgi:hypothetical protein
MNTTRHADTWACLACLALLVSAFPSPGQDSGLTAVERQLLEQWRSGKIAVGKVPSHESSAKAVSREAANSSQAKPKAEGGELAALERARYRPRSASVSAPLYRGNAALYSSAIQQRDMTRITSDLGLPRGSHISVGSDGTLTATSTAQKQKEYEQAMQNWKRGESAAEVQAGVELNTRQMGLQGYQRDIQNGVSPADALAKWGPMTAAGAVAPPPVAQPGWTQRQAAKPVLTFPSGVAENGSYFGEPNQYGVPKTVHVNHYFRSDGTYVRSHYRSPPHR